MSDKSVIDAAIEPMKLEDLKAPKLEKPVWPPALTNEKVEEVIVLLKRVEQNNGIKGVANKAKIDPSQVRAIWEKMRSKIAELTPIEVDEPIEPEPNPKPVIVKDVEPVEVVIK